MPARMEDGKLGDSGAIIDESRDSETGFTDVSETVAFLGSSKKSNVNGGADVEARNSYTESHHEKDDQFHGLSREELEKYATDPKWVKIRRILFAILVVAWVAMLVSAIIIVVVTEKCPPNPKLVWYQSGVAYRVETAKFQDSDGDEVGDFTGVKDHVEHFVDLSVKSVWLEDMIGKMTFTSGEMGLSNEEFGTIDDFKDLAATMKKKGIRVGVGLNFTNLDSEAEDNTAFTEVVGFWADAGAELFVISTKESVTEEVYAKITGDCQDFLDEEYNKQDDRNRVIIGADDMEGDAIANVHAAVYTPQYVCVEGLSPEMCDQKTIDLVGQANDNKEWKVVNVNHDLGSAACNLALRLTIPGTPNVMYGAEIGLHSGGFMEWDDSETRGFTSSNWTFPAQQMSVPSVLAQSAAGFDGPSIYLLFKDLAALRSKEPSLQWGNFEMLDFGDGVVAFVRKAEGYSSIVVAMNPGVGKAGSLVMGKLTQGEVLLASGIDVSVEDVVELDAIFLPKDGVLVARMSDPDAKKKVFG